MYIDLVHIQPLFREGPDTLVVKYTHPETGVNLEIPYDDLVNTVVAIDAMLTGSDESGVDVAVEPAPAPEVVETVEEVVTTAPSGLRVMRSRVVDED